MLKPISQRKEGLRSSIVAALLSTAGVAVVFCAVGLILGVFHVAVVASAGAAALGLGLSGVLLLLYELFGREIEFKPAREEIADIIESFVNKTDGPRDWDEFITLSIDDPELEAIRLHCIRLPQEYPSRDRTEYCSEKGIEVLLTYVAQLRSRDRSGARIPNPD